MHTSKTQNYNSTSFIRTTFNVLLASVWSVKIKHGFIGIESEDGSAFISKSEITGCCLDQTLERPCVAVLTKGALYRLLPAEGEDGPLLLRKIFESTGPTPTFDKSTIECLRDSD
jgi:hypothetical protein